VFALLARAQLGKRLTTGQPSSREVLEPADPEYGVLKFGPLQLSVMKWHSKHGQVSCHHWTQDLWNFPGGGMLLAYKALLVSSAYSASERAVIWSLCWNSSRKVSYCGMSKHFSSRFGIKPMQAKKFVASWECESASFFPSAITSMSSRYQINLIPSFLRTVTTGFINLVNTKGTLDRPNGNTFKLPKLAFPLEPAVSSVNWNGEISVLEVDQPPLWSRPFTVLIDSILKWDFTTWRLRAWRFITGLQDPSALGTTIIELINPIPSSLIQVIAFFWSYFLTSSDILFLISSDMMADFRGFKWGWKSLKVNRGGAVSSILYPWRLYQGPKNIPPVLQKKEREG